MHRDFQVLLIPVHNPGTHYVQKKVNLLLFMRGAVSLLSFCLTDNDQDPIPTDDITEEDMIV